MKEALLALLVAFAAFLVWCGIGIVLGFADTLRTHWDRKDILD
jgi:hypothetical protein